MNTKFIITTSFALLMSLVTTAQNDFAQWQVEVLQNKQNDSATESYFSLYGKLMSDKEDTVAVYAINGILLHVNKKDNEMVKSLFTAKDLSFKNYRKPEVVSVADLPQDVLSYVRKGTYLPQGLGWETMPSFSCPQLNVSPSGANNSGLVPTGLSVTTCFGKDAAEAFMRAVVLDRCSRYDCLRYERFVHEEPVITLQEATEKGLSYQTESTSTITALSQLLMEIAECKGEGMTEMVYSNIGSFNWLEYMDKGGELLTQAGYGLPKVVSSFYRKDDNGKYEVCITTYLKSAE